MICLLEIVVRFHCQPKYMYSNVRDGKPCQRSVQVWVSTGSALQIVRSAPGPTWNIPNIHLLLIFLVKSQYRNIIQLKSRFWFYHESLIKFLKYNASPCSEMRVLKNMIKILIDLTAESKTWRWVGEGWGWVGSRIN